MTDLQARVDGPQGGPPVVLLHALGLDASVFDTLIPHLPNHRILRPDLRGHGRSPAPKGPYKMGALVADVEHCMEAHDMTDAVVMGLSLGALLSESRSC